MQDYLVNTLQNLGKPIKKSSVSIVSGIETNLVKVDTDGVVLLIDQVYPNNALEEVYKKLAEDYREIAPVLIKDGKTFFRSAAKDKRFKSYGMSLKNYNDSDVNNMILFRPEEEFVHSIRPWVQYYQPESERLEEGIVSYKFQPVVFDYAHIEKENRHTDLYQKSKKLRIWSRRVFKNTPRKLEGGLLVRQ